MASRRVLVPIANTVTARATIDFAVDQANGGAIHIVYAVPGDVATPEGERERSRGQDLLDRAAAWVREDLIADEELDISTAVLGVDEYLFGPSDYAELFGEYSTIHQLETIIIDPEYWADTVGPMLASFENALSREGLDVVEPPLERPARHERVAGHASPAKLISLFVVSYGFYLLLGDPFYWFDIVTGAAVAGIVALTLGNVTWSRDPTFPGSIIRTVRFTLYIPYLIVQIVKANLIIATVILRPSMPIDPRMARIDAKVGGGLPLLALANSITLTPGTLTVRGDDQRLIVHTLVPAAREDLFDGRLERAVRFVFYGRQFARIPSPREREDVAILAEDEAR